MLENRYYYYAVVATNFVMLNLLWIVACLPVITIVSATAAMFGVIRDWHQDREAALPKMYLTYLRVNFARGLIVEVVWGGLGAALFLDFLLLRQTSGLAQIIFLTTTLFALSAYTSTSIFLFPLMVSYDLRWYQLLRSAFILSILHLPTTMKCLVVVISLVFLSWAFPALSIISGGLGSFMVYHFCCSACQRLEQTGVQPAQ